MVSRAGMAAAAVAAVLIVAGCGSTRETTCKCPSIVAYDDPTLKKITEALKALPADNVLHQAMDDYEQERDDLRFCK